jgi:hypothetical protein
MAENRKLAAILAADVVGYSRLAGSDEDRILARLRALRSDPAIGQEKAQRAMKPLLNIPNELSVLDSWYRGGRCMPRRSGRRRDEQGHSRRFLSPAVG